MIDISLLVKHCVKTCGNSWHSLRKDAVSIHLTSIQYSFNI